MSARRYKWDEIALQTVLMEAQSTGQAKRETESIEDAKSLRAALYHLAIRKGIRDGLRFEQAGRGVVVRKVERRVMR